MLFLLEVVLFLIFVVREIKQMACQLLKILSIQWLVFFCSARGATVRRRVFPRYPFRMLAR